MHTRRPSILEMLLVLSCCGFAVCGLACKHDSGQSTTDDNSEPERLMKVTGTLMKRDRKALPPTTVAEIRLVDVSKADVAAEELALQRIESPGQVPIAFELQYDPAVIHAGHSYAVQAKLLVDDELLYITDTRYPVLTRGAGNEVELMLVPVRR